MAINPSLTVAGLNSKGNILERVERLENLMRDFQVADQLPFNQSLLVADLILAPAPGVFVTDPTSTDYTGFFASGNGRSYGGNIYVTGNVVNGVIKTGFTDVGTLYAVDANVTGTITANAGAIGGWTIASNQIYSAHAVLSSAGEYLSLGTTPPTSYGSNVGMYMEGANGGRVSWYKDANNFLAWDSTKLLIKAANFTLDASGNITASNVTLSGSITATSGAIGGFTITSTAIKDTAGTMGMSSAVTGGNDIRFWAGNVTPASAPFQVFENGAVTASAITISGASTIAGWSIDNTRIYKLSSNIGVILDSSIPAIKIGDSAGTYMLLDGANQLIKSSNYVSGLIGSSWTTSTGEAEFNNVTIRGAIKVTAMQYGHITATGGTNWVVPATGILRGDCTSVDSPATFAVTVKDPDGISHASAGALWTVGDIIMLREPLTGVLYASISSKTDNTTYWTLNVVKQSPGAGTNYTFRAGLAIVNFGASGQGFVSLSADGTVGSSPNITMATHAGSPWTTTSTRMRMGNLNGSYGYATNVYGVGMGQYGTAGQPSLTVDTTNGIRIISNTTTIGQWDASGNIVVGQVAASQSNVQITSGGINIRNNTTVLASWDSAGAITVGQVAASQSNILISSGALSIRNNTTVLANWASTGTITIGQAAASQNNIVISSGDISIRNNTTERIGITAAGILTIKDSGGAAVLTFDASTGAEITKKLTMSGASSAIALGTTPPTANNAGTGLWIDRVGVYALTTGTQNATLTSAGLTAAGGLFTADSTGIFFTQGTGFGNSIAWKNGATYVGTMYVGDTGSATTMSINMGSASRTTKDMVLQALGSGSTNGSITLQVSTGGAVNPLLVADGANNLVSLAPTGKVGIGNPSPFTRTLEVNGTFGLSGDATLAARLNVGTFLNLDSSVLTIASDAVTATKSRHTVDTQGGAATDDLSTINGGSPNDILIISSVNNARDVTLKDGVGNLLLAGDCVLDTAQDIIVLIRLNSTNWVEVCRSNNA